MRLARLLLILSILMDAVSASADGLEPEEGVFAGHSPPSPYDLVLRQALIGDDRYRLCQMVYLPSFHEESAVYITHERGKPFVVVSRTIKKQLWTRMLDEMEKASPTKNSFSMDSMYQSAALKRIRAAVDTRTTNLDDDVATIVVDACRDVLLQVRYPKNSTMGLDGTAYHAGHWIPGAFLSGKTWSPKEGTVAADFVAMEMVLQAYANSTSEKKATLKSDLLAKAKHLKKVVESSLQDASAPANPALQTDRASPGR
jgi:hypothetical protein